MKGFYNKLNDVGEWIYRLIFLNVLWIGFTILGLGILGVFPATNALFAVLRKFLLNKKDVKIASDFYHFYRKDFVKSNALGYILTLIAAVIWVDFRYFMSITNVGMLIVGNLMLVLLVFVLLALCVVFPIFSHYEMSFGQYVKNALLYPFTHLLPMILFVISIILFDLIVNQLPGFLPFIGISFPCFIMMKILLANFQHEKSGAKGWFKRKRDETIYY
jgi:uncharacterized membrane protein YesL